MPEHQHIRIGTSGWHYDHWVGPFYPPDIAKDRLLSYYAGRFDTVEINRTFYSLPSRAALRTWRDSTLPGFVFAVKASRYITHLKKLKDCQEAIDKLWDTIEALRPKLGPVLFQLPPRWRRNPGRLDEFIAKLPAGGNYAFEFRDASWFHDEVYQVLRDRKAAFCIYDLAGNQAPRVVTTSMIYVRLHGPSQTAYQGEYPDPVLADWAGAFRAWSKQGHDIWCFFDNDQAGYAARDAARLRDMLNN
jgi:uncharacterized protein YecE (DUF72 family)